MGRPLKQSTLLNITANFTFEEAPATADINKQTGTHRYNLVGEGRAPFRLAAVGGSDNLMTIEALDSDGNTYNVTRVHDRKLRVHQTGGGTHQFADGTLVLWTFAAAVEDYSVTLGT